MQDILGTGLVTSEGALWAKQRKLVSNAFRVEILDDIVGVALRAVERLVRSAAPAGRAQLTRLGSARVWSWREAPGGLWRSRRNSGG